MDTFIDKLSLKRNAQGMINANAAADAAKMERLQNRMAEYDALLQEMRRINLRTAENVEQARNMLLEGFEKIRAIQANSNAQADKEEILAAEEKQTEAVLSEMKAQSDTLMEELKKQLASFLEETEKQSKELLAETKMQSETLAAETKRQSETLLAETKRQSDTLLAETKRQSEELLAETKKQSETLLTETKGQPETFLAETKRQSAELLAEAEKQSKTFLTETREQKEELLAENEKRSEELRAEITKQLEESFNHSEDFLHKENVKVYRNVQAAIIEELNRQTEALTAKQQEGAGKQKAALPISIVIMLLVIADIVIKLLNITLF